MGRACVLAVVVVLGLAACAEDEAAAVVSQESYDEAAARACDRHGESVRQARFEEFPDSDAQEAAFYRTELVPRLRAIVDELLANGLPADNAADYQAAFNEVLTIAGSLESAPFRYIDQRHGRALAEGEDLLVRVERALEQADVRCL